MLPVQSLYQAHHGHSSRAQVKYEPAAAVGNTPASSKNSEQQFPHLYGAINLSAVITTLPMQRAEDGRFQSVSGLSEFKQRKMDVS